MEGIAAYLNVNSASNGIQIINSYAAAEEFARRCLTHVIERVLVPHQPFMTEAECTVVIKDILRNCGIRWRNAVPNDGSARIVSPYDWEA